ncbi:SDR family oxidoreductase [Vreelandella titanicae]|uniref:SDR family oxidoreductase n=1 Tax=Halomonadaceae TaxID=28256 RepID=UPI0018C66430
MRLNTETSGNVDGFSVDVACGRPGAVEGFTCVLAKEFGMHGITVNAVAPGPVETELFLGGKS